MSFDTLPYAEYEKLQTRKRRAGLAKTLHIDNRFVEYKPIRTRTLCIKPINKEFVLNASKVLFFKKDYFLYLELSKMSFFAAKDREKVSYLTRKHQHNSSTSIR